MLPSTPHQEPHTSSLVTSEPVAPKGLGTISSLLWPTFPSLSRETPFFYLPALPEACPDPFQPTSVTPCPRSLMGCFQHSPVPAFTPSSFTPGPTFPLGFTPSHSTLGELPGPKCPIGHGVCAQGLAHWGLGKGACLCFCPCYSGLLLP